jgi:hypothetical protein
MADFALGFQSPTDFAVAVIPKPGLRLSAASYNYFNEIGYPLVFFFCI